MPVSLEFMRGILGFIGIGCAFMLGRSTVAVRKGRQKQSTLIGWAIRVLLCLGAVAFRHAVDAADILVWSFSAVAFGVALWESSREKKEEDLTKAMFPEE
ncbi:conserved membrane hypothetical protein [Candidatus Sulfopaludibacter sp. SbA3]|nr:conserved membrane hypothetical protein [Candidatus Sulfopaludibacter sp. SbA3]